MLHLFFLLTEVIQISSTCSGVCFFFLFQGTIKALFIEDLQRVKNVSRIQINHRKQEDINCLGKFIQLIIKRIKIHESKRRLGTKRIISNK